MSCDVRNENIKVEEIYDDIGGKTDDDNTFMFYPKITKLEEEIDINTNPVDIANQIIKIEQEFEYDNVQDTAENHPVVSFSRNINDEETAKINNGSGKY